MAKMADLWQTQFDYECYNGAYCPACHWNSPNVKEIAFCPNCGADGVEIGEGVFLDAIKPKNQKRRALQLDEFQALRGLRH